MCKKFVVYVLFFVFVVQGIFLRSAVATNLFEDNFDSYANSAAFRAGILNGTSGWEAVRFQSGSSNNIISDVGIGHHLLFGEGNYGTVTDDTGIMFQINTVDIENPLLSFDWRTVGLHDEDNLRVGYYLGDLPVDSDHVTNFQNRGHSWFQTDWTKIVYARSHGSSILDYLLPTGAPSLWIAFWFDNSGHRYGAGILDNVRVTGNEIPEPATMLLLGSALIGINLRRRNKLRINQ